MKYTVAHFDRKNNVSELGSLTRGLGASTLECIDGKFAISIHTSTSVTRPIIKDHYPFFQVKGDVMEIILHTDLLIIHPTKNVGEFLGIYITLILHYFV